MMDISKCFDLIPEKYKTTHAYDGSDDVTDRNIINMPDGSVPRDLAFCRWMAAEKKVVMMPGVLFYDEKSPYKVDNFVRVAICANMKDNIEAMKRIKSE